MLKFSGCSCLTSGRKPKGVLHNAFGSTAGNEGMQPAKVTYQIGTRLSSKGKRPPKREYISADRPPKGQTGRPDPTAFHRNSPMKFS